jgi:hypothetical protein
MADEAPIVEIEAFRAGGKASRGITPAQLDEAIASYTSTSATDPAPLVFGHPESNDPAHGIIATVKREGSKLITGLKNISAEAIQGVKDGKFLNRSIAFWHPDHSANPTPGKWNIRHVGLLGAASPGIPGMSKLTFSADESAIESDQAPDTAVIFAEEATPTVTITSPKGGKPVADKPELAQEQFDALEAENKRLKDAAEARAIADKTAREAANASFAADLVEQGRITPAMKVLVTETLNRLPVEEVQFDAGTKGSLADEWRKVLGKAEPVIIFEALSPQDARKQAEQDPQAIADKAAVFMAEQEKLGRSVSAAEAVAHVTKGA